jgi:hypothetical protein
MKCFLCAIAAVAILSLQPLPADLGAQDQQRAAKTMAW